MSSEIKADLIKDKSGTKTLATLSSSTVTLDSSVVFPDGHVIQTVYNSFNNGNSNTITSATTAKFTSANTSGEEYKAQISNLTSGNDVLIHFNFVGSVDKSDISAGGSFAIYRDSTIIYEGTDDLQTFSYTTASDATINRVIRITHVSILFMDESPSSTSHTYFVGGSASSSTGVMIRSSSGYAPFTAILQEIQR
tara:strand:+ start:30 stop:614 length:585 start_codon:yes stop_codon:yes gene_type:complete